MEKSSKLVINFKKLQNHLRLLEVAQVPKDNIEDFKSVKKFNVFNTNNLWISLPAVQRVIEEGTLDMEVIVNPKTLDGGVNVIQLEVRRLQNYIYDRLFYWDAKIGNVIDPKGFQNWKFLFLNLVLADVGLTEPNILLFYIWVE